jgi:hypothetical protein
MAISQTDNEGVWELPKNVAASEISYVQMSHI